MRKLSFFISQGAKNLFRNGFMTAASTFILIICMIVIGSFWLIYQNIEYFLSNTDELYVLKANIADTVVGENTDAPEIKELFDKIKSLDNVKECTFISSEEAFDSLKESVPEFSHLLDNQHNPMGRSFDVTFSDPEKIDKLIYEIKNIPGIENTRERLDVYNTASRLRNTLSVICIWIFISLFIVSILVIMTTVRITIYARREEIYIMRYLGATGSFISAPFFIEGIIIGIAAAALSFGIQYYLYDFIVKGKIKDFLGQNLVSFGDNVTVIALGFLGVGLFAGVLATAVSIKRYLKA